MTIQKTARDLVDILQLMDYYKSESDEAIREAKAGGVWELLKEVPEYMQWRELRLAIVDELTKVIESSESSLPSCERLRLAFRDGGARYEDFVFEARVELERLAAESHDWREHNAADALGWLGLRSYDTLGKHADSDKHPYLEKIQHGHYRIDHSHPFIKGKAEK